MIGYLNNLQVTHMQKQLLFRDNPNSLHTYVLINKSQYICIYVNVLLFVDFFIGLPFVTFLPCYDFSPEMRETDDNIDEAIDWMRM